MDTITEFKRRMSNKFEMSDLGKLTYYLGIEVCQHEQGITLNQERYAKKILSETKMDECNDVQIPMDQGLRLSKASNEKNIYEKEYRRNIGCLRYLLHTTPDLSYFVGVLSRYAATYGVTWSSAETNPRVPERIHVLWIHVQSRN